MNPMPFIIASYALAIVVPVVLAVAATLRMRRAERLFATVDPRAGRRRR